MGRSPAAEAVMPFGFSWVDPPHLAAHAFPDAAADLVWLRRQGIDVLVTLTEHPLPKAWVNDAGLMGVHIPIYDMHPPSLRQMEQAVDTLVRAKQSGMAAAVHCLAGKGRTGTILAGYFVSQGMPAADAIRKVRELRPWSIETSDQEQAVHDWERHRKAE